MSAKTILENLPQEDSRFILHRLVARAQQEGNISTDDICKEIVDSHSQFALPSQLKEMGRNKYDESTLTKVIMTTPLGGVKRILIDLAYFNATGGTCKGRALTSSELIKLTFQQAKRRNPMAYRGMDTAETANSRVIQRHVGCILRQVGFKNRRVHDKENSTTLRVWVLIDPTMTVEELNVHVQALEVRVEADIEANPQTESNPISYFI